jgi:hypothetical protein
MNAGLDVFIMLSFFYNTEAYRHCIISSSLGDLRVATLSAKLKNELKGL